jgi:hypothetical protein
MIPAYGDAETKHKAKAALKHFSPSPLILVRFVARSTRESNAPHDDIRF